MSSLIAQRPESEANGVDRRVMPLLVTKKGQRHDSQDRQVFEAPRKSVDIEIGDR